MATDINFSKRSLSRLPSEKILQYMQIGAVIYGVFVVSLSVAGFLMSRDTTLQNLQSQQQSLVARLNLLQTKATNIILVHDRISRIASLLPKQFAYQTTIDTIEQQLPSDVAINSISFTKTEVAFSASSTSLISLEKMTDNLTKLIKQKKIFKQMTIQGVTSGAKNTSYTLAITLELL